MNELEILNNILINEVYKDKLLLELELDKVDDRLSIGLLTELLVKLNLIVHLLQKVNYLF